MVFGRWLLVFGFRRGDVSDNHRAAAGQKVRSNYHGRNCRHPSVRIIATANSGTRPFELPRPQLPPPVRSICRNRNFLAPVRSIYHGRNFSGTRPFELSRPFPAPVRLPGRRGETIAQGAVHRDGCLHHYHQQADPGSMPRSNMEMRPADVGGRASPARRERTCGPPTNGMDPEYSSTTSPARPGARCRRNLLRQTAFGLK